MDKLIGTMLDNRYEVLEVIGTGGMAIVYKAKCHRLNRYVAVKVMKEELAKDEEFRRRFFEESQAVAMLSHPNIVNVYDVSRSGDIEYIVMELIDGITLKEYLEKRGVLSWKETAFFSLQIAKALEHAHSRGIIHRDIKPQNIMLLRDGTVKVADFGIAHHTSDQSNYIKGEAIGSVHYVSPEQARGSHIDNRSDIYSFGVVMYEMLTGRLPFEGNTPMEIIFQHINSIPLPPSDYEPGIPQALEAITMKAMNPTPSKRYSSATEMIADLERFKEDPDVKIEFENPLAFSAGEDKENDIDATRKIHNPGEIAKAALEHDKEKDDEDKKKAFKSTAMIAFGSIMLFLIGVLFFLFKVIDPFGSDENVKLQAPKLVGLEYEDVLKDEDYESFEITLAEEIYDDSTAKGFIISQSPEEGKNISEGSTISVVVSLGSKTVTVDDYVGMDGRSVLVILERLGLTVKSEYEYSDDVEDGIVMSTDPVKDTVVNSGDTITVTISKGPETKMATVPYVVGQPLEKANELLAAANLTGSVTYTETDSQPEGYVIYQSIAAGSSVAENTVVGIQVSKAPEVTEQPKEEATIEYVVEIDDLEGDIEIMVAVDSKVEYKASHTADEETVVVSLTAEEGGHSVTVFQNGRLTKEENVTFR